MKIKIFTYHSQYDDYGESIGSYLGPALTDWIEVDSGDLEIVENFIRKNRGSYTTDEQIIIVREIDVDTQVSEFNFLLKRAKDKIEKDKEIERKFKEREEKRLKTLELKKKEKARKTVEQLRRELEEAEEKLK